MSDHLRQYQIKAVDAVFDEWTRVQATVLHKATGTGKTVCVAEIVKRSQPKRALILAHRRELVHQAQSKIEKFTDLDAEVEMAGERASRGLFSKCHAVVSSVQSQTPGRRSNPMDFDILIVDECHHCKPNNKSYMDVLNHYKQNPNLKILGLTATLEPACMKVFETVAFTYDLPTAINDGYLVNIEPKVVTINDLDYSHIRTTAGDLNGADLAAVVESEKVCQGMIMGTLEVMFEVPQHSLIDLPIDKWGEFLFMDGKPRKNLVFTVSVDQAKMMSDIFNRVKPGLSAWVCGDINLVSEERRKIVGKDFNTGELLIVTNCGVYSEGYDNPNIRMVTMARPTKSKTLFTQQIGRGTRILDGVIDGIHDAVERLARIASSAKRMITVLDFVGNFGKHDIFSTVDLMGDGYSKEVKARAKQKAEKSIKPQSAFDLLKESQAELEAEKLKRDQEEAARKARLVAKASYSVSTLDPFEKYKVGYQKATYWDKQNGRALSENQRWCLRNKIGVDPDAISGSCARKLLGEYHKRPTDAQAGVLRRAKYSDTEIAAFTKASASDEIDKLSKNGWKKPQPQNTA